MSDKRTMREELNDAYAALEAAAAEIARLQAIIDSRPAINAGLPKTYIEWSRAIYEVEAIRAGSDPS